MPFPRLSDEAEEDLAQAFYHIALEDRDAAHRVLNNILATFELLGEQPYLGRERPEIGLGARAFVVGKYLILYRVVDEEPQVFRVLHSSQDIQSILNG